MLPVSLDNLVSQYSGTADQITATLNTDQVVWSPIAISDINSYCDETQITQRLKALLAQSPVGSPAWSAADAGLSLRDAKYVTVSMHIPEKRAAFLAGLDALVSLGVVTADQREALINMGRQIVNLAKTANNGNLLNDVQVQAAMDRNARRIELTTWYNAALTRITNESPVPTLQELLSHV